MQRVAICLAIGLWACGGLAPAQDDSPDSRQFEFANGLFVRGRYDPAVEQYRFAEAYNEYQKARQLLVTGPERDQVITRLGEIALRLNRAPEAEQLLSQLIHEKPDPKVVDAARYHLARALLAQNKIAAAVPVLESLVNQQPPSPFRLYAQLELAQAYRQSNK